MVLIKGLRAGSVVCSAILLLFVLPVAAASADKNGASPEKGAPSEGAEPKTLVQAMPTNPMRTPRRRA